MSQQIKIVHQKTNPEEPINPELTSPANPEPAPPKKRSSAWMIILIIIISLIFGGIGGALAQKIIIPFIEQKYLAKNDQVVVSGKTENITVKENSATIDAVKKVNPSVVSIIGNQSVQDIFGGVSTQKSAGTGFVLTSDGLILTNKHVVSGNNAQYTVLTSDGQDYKATIAATDPANDLAVVKIDAKNLPVLELGDSSQLVPGQEAIAIGNALGEYQNTVTAGVISAVGRAVSAGDTQGGNTETIEGAIQTDAAINPGNSGGPLINIGAQVVGINTAVDQNGQTIGFAIPINVIKPLDNFINSVRAGKIIRPMLGVSYIPITKELAALNKLSVVEGALVAKGSGNNPAVSPGGPADSAGIEEGDIITAVNGQKIDKNNSLSYLIQQLKPGEEVELTVLRNGQEQKIKVKLGQMS